MATDNKDDMKEFEEEFDFESDEDLHDDLPIDDEDVLAPHSSSTADNTSAQGVSIDKKPSKLPLLIGIAAIGFIGYQGYKMIFAKDPNDIPPPATTQITKAETKASEISTTNIPTGSGTQPASASSATMPSQDQPNPSAIVPTGVPTANKSPDLFTPPIGAVASTPSPVPAAPGQLETLEDNTKKTQERLGKLETRFGELMDAMGTLNQNMNQLSREMSTVNDSIQKVNKDVKTLKDQNQAAPSLQTPVQKQETKAAGPSPTVGSSAPMLSVHAIIPGRAWLKSRDGSTITVTEGDSLDRFGKVLVIDASNGVVITSSGVTLR